MRTKDSCKTPLEGQEIGFPYEAGHELQLFFLYWYTSELVGAWSWSLLAKYSVHFLLLADTAHMTSCNIGTVKLTSPQSDWIVAYEVAQLTYRHLYRPFSIPEKAWFHETTYDLKPSRPGASLAELRRHGSARCIC